VHILQGSTSHGKYYFWDGDWLGAKTAAGEFLDSYLLPWMNALKPGQKMVDVGAHIGTFTIYLALRGVKVLAFEASPEVFALLRMNVEENRISELVTLYNVALYDSKANLRVSPDCAYEKLEDGKLNYASKDCSGWLWLEPGVDVYGFEARALDSFEIEDVAFIKVDAEGCDLRVLQGARETIRKYRPVICYEFNKKPAFSNGYDVEELNAFVRSLDYEVIVAKCHGEENIDFVGVPR